MIKDVGHRTMLESINAFGKQLSDNDVGLFYYAGHAIQQNGNNYLLPTKEAEHLTEATLEFDAIDINRVLAQMEYTNSAVNIVILDACRNNPFRGFRRALTRGLAQPKTTAKGMYIAYATAPGEVAYDSDLQNTKNSPYTKALAKYLPRSGLSIHDVFQNVRRDVMTVTNEKQIPWENSSLTDKFYFAGEIDPADQHALTKMNAQLEAMKQQLAAAEARSKIPTKQPVTGKPLAEKKTVSSFSSLFDRVIDMIKDDKPTPQKRIETAHIKTQENTKHNTVNSLSTDKVKTKVTLEKDEHPQYNNLQVNVAKTPTTTTKQPPKEPTLLIKPITTHSATKETKTTVPKSEQVNTQDIEAFVQAKKQTAKKAIKPTHLKKITKAKNQNAANNLFKQCETRFKKHKPSVKSGECYNKVLALNAKHSEALNRMRIIIKHYEMALDKAIEKSKIKRAKKQLSSLSKLAPQKTRAYESKIKQKEIELKQKKSTTRIISTF